MCVDLIIRHSDGRFVVRLVTIVEIVRIVIIARIARIDRLVKIDRSGIEPAPGRRTKSCGVS